MPHLSLKFYSETVSPVEFKLYAGNFNRNYFKYLCVTFEFDPFHTESYNLECCTQNLLFREPLVLKNLQQIFMSCENTNHTQKSISLLSVVVWDIVHKFGT